MPRYLGSDNVVVKHDAEECEALREQLANAIEWINTRHGSSTKGLECLPALGSRRFAVYLSIRIRSRLTRGRCYHSVMGNSNPQVCGPGDSCWIMPRVISLLDWVILRSFSRLMEHLLADLLTPGCKHSFFDGINESLRRERS
jgi:hypothetical protein